MDDRFFPNEKGIIELFADRHSMSASIFVRLDLCRDIIKKAMEGLQRHRAVQVVLYGVTVAIRFKYYQGGTLRDTMRPRPVRVQRDRYEDVVECCGLRPLEEKGTRTVDFLIIMQRYVKMTKRGPPVLTPMEDAPECADREEILRALQSAI